MLVYSDVRGTTVCHGIKIKRGKGLLAYSINGVFSLLWFRIEKGQGLQVRGICY